jgi:hypothetical protein
VKLDGTPASEAHGQVDGQLDGAPVIAVCLLVAVGCVWSALA